MDWLYRNKLALTNNAKLKKIIRSRLFLSSSDLPNKKTVKAAVPAVLNLIQLSTFLNISDSDL